jgi:chromate transporter
MEDTNMHQPKGTVKEVAGLFFKLGCIAFGGPAAHIAMMEEEVVNKRKWMDRQHFLDLIGATNLIPGPNSTEMTMHCGHERAGVPGLFAAGLCFIFPAVVLTGILAWAYVTYGQLPEVLPFINGIKPAVLAIIAGAVWKLGKKAIKGWELAVLASLVLLSSLAGLNEILALLTAGVLGTFYLTFSRSADGSFKAMLPLLLSPKMLLMVQELSHWKIFLSFLKVGAVLYGSGYVLFAYLDAELVLSTATFIGYQLGGIGGALAATAGIFLPSFLFVWVLNPLVPKMRSSKPLGYFLDSVNAAAVAVMLAVLIHMAAETLLDWRAILIALLGGLATFGPVKLNAIWIVLGGAALGYLLQFVQFG